MASAAASQTPLRPRVSASSTCVEENASLLAAAPGRAHASQERADARERHEAGVGRRRAQHRLPGFPQLRDDDGGRRRHLTAACVCDVLGCLFFEFCAATGPWAGWRSSNATCAHR